MIRIVHASGRIKKRNGCWLVEIGHGHFDCAAQLWRAVEVAAEELQRRGEVFSHTAYEDGCYTVYARNS